MYIAIIIQYSPFVSQRSEAGFYLVKLLVTCTHLLNLGAKIRASICSFSTFSTEDENEAYHFLDDLNFVQEICKGQNECNAQN